MCLVFSWFCMTYDTLRRLNIVIIITSRHPEPTDITQIVRRTLRPLRIAEDDMDNIQIIRLWRHKHNFILHTQLVTELIDTWKVLSTDIHPYVGLKRTFLLYFFSYSLCALYCRFMSYSKQPPYNSYTTPALISATILQTLSKSNAAQPWIWLVRIPTVAAALNLHASASSYTMQLAPPWQWIRW